MTTKNFDIQRIKQMNPIAQYPTRIGNITMLYDSRQDTLFVLKGKDYTLLGYFPGDNTFTFSNGDRYQLPSPTHYHFEQGYIPLYVHTIGELIFSNSLS